MVPSPPWRQARRGTIMESPVDHREELGGILPVETQAVGTITQVAVVKEVVEVTTVGHILLRGELHRMVRVECLVLDLEVAGVITMVLVHRIILKVVVDLTVGLVLVVGQT